MASSEDVLVYSPDRSCILIVCVHRFVLGVKRTATTVRERVKSDATVCVVQCAHPQCRIPAITCVPNETYPVRTEITVQPVRTWIISYCTIYTYCTMYANHS